jgi:penicillin V acylase-like amidase (Ntn superfamily)
MCTRLTYLGPDNIVLTGRSLDWTVPMDTSIWVQPAGIERNGAAGPDSLQWTSKYGSLTAVGYGAATIDGFNERGLLVNVLYLAEADYGTAADYPGKPTVSVAGWGQFVLDNYATVAEAVAGLRQEPIRVVTLMLPDNNPAVAHLSLSDPSGDSAIIEYVNGKQQIYHSRDYQVMTNSPAFSEQLALSTYWQQIGDAMLPGTGRAADRFVRSSYYLHTIPTTADEPLALASTFAVIRNASVPLGVESDVRPNDASTRWRVVTDLKNRLYYFDSAMSPSLFWIAANQLDFSQGAPVLKLTLDENCALVDEGAYVAGNANGFFKPAELFHFLPA